MAWSRCPGEGPALTSEGHHSPRPLTTYLPGPGADRDTLPFVLLAQDQLDELSWGPRSAAQLLPGLPDPIRKAVTTGEKMEGPVCQAPGCELRVIMVCHAPTHRGTRPRVVDGEVLLTMGGPPESTQGQREGPAPPRRPPGGGLGILRTRWGRGGRFQPPVARVWKRQG